MYFFFVKKIDSVNILQK